MKDNKHIHFIAIGGSIMHQLAIALHQKGYKVTGSDDEIYDPAKSNLFKYGLLPNNMGWNATRIQRDLDAVIVGMHAKKDNPELIRAKSLNLPIYSYPEYIFKQSETKQRVVIGGSHGKTTTTSMVMHVLKYWNYDFDYLVGAKLAGFDYSVRITNAPIIVLEGDEYLSSPIHRQPKFHYYQPQISILTGIAWDHINVFPTYENYVSQFEQFIQTLPDNATLVYNTEDATVKKLAEENRQNTLKTVPYQTLNHHYEKGKAVIETGEQNYKLQIFGKHNIQNLAGAKALCAAIGIDETQFMEAITQFKGAARRLELLGEENNTVVFKDFAHAPSKVQATTNALKEAYPNRGLVACLELHTYSSLNEKFLPHYKETLNAAETAFVFYNEHTFKIKRLPYLSKKQVYDAFQHPNLKVITDKTELDKVLRRINYHNKNLLLMSSGTFGGLNLNDITKFALTTNNGVKQKTKPMPLKLSRPLAIFDIEATGISTAKDRIVEISMLKVLPDGSETSKTMRINPTIPIPEQASEIHGIYDKDVKDLPTFAEVAHEIANFLSGCDLGGYNSNRYDIPLLNEEFLRVNIDFELEDKKFVDVFRIFQKKEPRTLEAAYKLYCDKSLINAHSAEADVRATYEVLLAQIEKYEPDNDLQNTMKSLHEYTTNPNIVDLAGRLAKNNRGDIVFNFGKHKGKPVEKVIRETPQYYNWMMNNDFPLDTKQRLREIKTKMDLSRNSNFRIRGL
ncbi:MAG: exonuclease domain-containing protein [Chitinophagales bacterium]